MLASAATGTAGPRSSMAQANLVELTSSCRRESGMMLSCEAHSGYIA
jgi:hypothetical protein